MSREDRIKGILQEAGVESAVRRPAEVIDLPVRSAWLAKTAAPKQVEPEVRPAPEVPPDVKVYPEWVGWGVRASKYLGFACVVVAVLLVWSGVRQTLILADVGRSTCSTLAIADTPEAQAFWTEEDPASTVPKLRTRQFVACMKAGEPF